MAGVDLGQALADAKAQTHPVYPTLREALPPFLDDHVELGNLRRSTASAYENRLRTWAFPRLGDVPWNLLTREEIGAVLLAIRKAGKSAASVEQVRCPLTRFYQWQQNVHGYRGANPAAELKFFIGRQPSKKGRKRDLQWFRQGEARTLLEACQAIKPRWVAFLMVCFGGGLRWGEATALSAQDIDWPRERVHVARTWSEGGGRIEECKDSEDRWVKLPPATMAALRAHREGHGSRGEREGLGAVGAPARLPKHGGPGDAVWRVPRARVAAAPGRRQAPVPEAARHAPQLRDVAARGRR